MGSNFRRRYCTGTDRKSDERRENGGVQTLQDLKGSWPSDVYAEKIPARGNIGIRLLVELFHRILDGLWNESRRGYFVAISIFKG